MWKTIVFLCLSLVLGVYAAYNMDTELSEIQSVVLIKLVLIYVVVAGLCFVVSSLTANYSQVDKLWSIMPILYAWVVVIESAYEGRIFLMACLITLWGLRLTYNFSRRGGYQWKFWEGEEDYRWAVLRQRKELSHPLVWAVFNLLFISFYQMGLILLFILPIVKCLEGSPLTCLDAVLAVVVIGLIIIETVADQQQWQYHLVKNKLKADGSQLQSPYDKGFVHHGLWKYARHPNYGAEQAIWIVIYFFSILATDQWLNWSIAGCILLILLFKGSSDFSEQISRSKYPEYADYMAKTPRFIPHIFRRTF